jgi:hypothetical protein
MSAFEVLQAVALVWLLVSLVGIAGLLSWAILTSMAADGPEEEHQGAPTVPFTSRYPLPDVKPRPLDGAAAEDVEMTDAHIARRLEIVRRQNEAQ